MLSQADNEFLVRVGPGTPMGDLFRRFWTPVMLADEIPEPDGPPVRVNVLGEKFVAFRDTNGRIGLLDAYCPHRRANLFWGRNEECGLRCAYHGWKFDVTGQCVDAPNAVEGDRLKSKIKTRAYPTVEHGELIWAYFGPPEKKPAFPCFDVFSGPASHRHMVKVFNDANWLQLMEGDVDSSHVQFLHSRIDGAANVGVRMDEKAWADRTPLWVSRETGYGLLLAARRNYDDDRYFWRVNQWLMPYCTLIAGPDDRPYTAQIRVPVDDETTLLFRVYVSRNGPLTAEDRAYVANGIAFPDMASRFEMKEKRENDYLIDREDQKLRTYSGIKSVVAEDLAVTEDQGGRIVDRSREWLTSADRAIVALRKRFLAAAKALQAGTEPPEVAQPMAYRVRSFQLTLARDRDIQSADNEPTMQELAVQPS
jgi:nitrite reductase/ring-hydroxylating ferredoxin subunit